MRKRKLAFKELINANKINLENDKKALEMIERKIEENIAKKAL
ncbi:FbpB family small basic protein [Neobacillus terrae]|nr:FbpB family small basic protein [Neobacillus terrae]NHM30942.1 FbpB family small basic protein [Neobacillus terrae]